MRVSDNWIDYQLLDTSNGEKLEKWKETVLIRPDPQIIWDTEKVSPLWNNANARYHRSDKGGGKWEVYKKHPDFWTIDYNGLKFKISPTGFKHTGLFPEQAVNWDKFLEWIPNAGRPISVLNLFAYTGGATVACLSAGANVTHVDASKGMVQWAKENAAASGVASGNVRWLVDDCLKFVKREIRRGKKYDAIIMDPPSYGRGPGGEVWKLEQQLTELLTETGKLLSDNALFFFLNSYTGGLSPTILNYMVKQYVVKNRKGEVYTDEIGLPITEKGISMPCGNTTIWIK